MKLFSCYSQESEKERIKMMNAEKYTRQYFMPPKSSVKWIEKEYIEKPPIWCSVDLRDGNQALVVPMSLEQKVEFFKMLVEIGFKEIEVGFPAASETEYEFLRTLIEQNLIPADVTIQVLTQAREHIIRKTFEAVKGAPKAVIHLYNSVSVAQRDQVFQKNKEEILKIATDGAKLLKTLADETDGNFAFEYSPESFTGCEVDYALEVCNAVLDIWQPSEENKVIINIPATVEHSMPHIYASQIEYLSDHLKYRKDVILSLHPHNDRGCGVSDAELGLLAGADRIEGTLFGNGERTGNVDIVTLAINMFSQGVDPKLDFTEMPKIVEAYEQFTNMKVYDRQPYAGSLVFTAFSGSHQDAIAKGMKWRESHDCKHWTVPYLPIDPKDIGRNYDGDVIRINSQSGKGGIGYLLEQKFGLNLPPKMREAMGYATKSVSDHNHKELSPKEIYDIFMHSFVDITKPYDAKECHFKQQDGITATVTVCYNGEEHILNGVGNGRLDAVSNAIKTYYGMDFQISCYQEHALEQGSSSNAIAYVGINYGTGKTSWGAGINSDIIKASVQALVSAINNRIE